MNCIERLEQFENDDFDRIILNIKNGTIKSGRYAHLIKIDKNNQMKGKEFFDDGENNSSKLG